MTLDQVKEVAKRYSGLLMSLYGHHGIRLDSYLMGAPSNLLTADQRVQHLIWMCWELETIVDGKRSEKAMRWLGFLQGALWAFGYRALEQLKQDNMPKDEAFDGNRV